MPGIRVFFEDGKPRRVSFAQLYRLRDGLERLPEHAGERVRDASIVLDTVNRRPVAVSNVELGILVFDSKGRVDQKAEMEEMVNMWRYSRARWLRAVKIR